MKTYVVLLNWNGWKDTLASMSSLQESVGVEFVTIVCDNDSKDGSLARFRSWTVHNAPGGLSRFLSRAEVLQGAKLDPGVKYAFVDNGRNLGYAGGNNSGVCLAMNDPACEYIWLLNNDTVVDSRALIEALDRARGDKRIGICGSTLVYFDDRSTIQAFAGSKYEPASGRSRHVGACAHITDIPIDPTDTESELSCIVGAAMLVSREFVEQVGMMQEDYFLYYEELDWAARGATRFRLGYAPRSLVYHKEGASIGTAATGGSQLSLYYLFRNRIRFSWRFHRAWMWTVFPSCGWDILKLVLKGRFGLAAAALRGIFMLPLVRGGR
jgi:GT2 family glycosyltransferase